MQVVLNFDSSLIHACHSGAAAAHSTVHGDARDYHLLLAGRTLRSLAQNATLETNCVETATFETNRVESVQTASVEAGTANAAKTIESVLEAAIQKAQASAVEITEAIQKARWEAIEAVRVEVDTIRTDAIKRAGVEVIEQVKKELVEQVKKEIIEQVKKEIIEQVKKEIIEQVKKEVIEQLQEEIIEKGATSKGRETNPEVMSEDFQTTHQELVETVRADGPRGTASCANQD